MNKKKILELCLSPDLGGLEIYMQKCSRILSNHFNVIAVTSTDSKLSERLKKDKVRTSEIKFKSRYSLLAAYRLAKIIDKNEIEIVHCHWTKELPIAVLAKKLSKIKPKIIQSRHMTMTRFKNDPIHKKIYENIDHIICVTKAVEEQIVKFIPSDIRPNTSVLYPGADLVNPITESELNELRGSNNDENFIAGIVGRITPDKGQHLLIEAVYNLLQERINIKAIIVGHAMTDSYLDELKNKVKNLNLENNISFYSFTNNPEKFMQSCDVMVTASKQETFGLVTVEAMQCGVAVIAANSGGTLEIIDDNITGLLFENENSTDLAEKIKKLYIDKELRKNIAENGRKKAKELFESNTHFNELADLIEAF